MLLGRRITAADYVQSNPSLHFSAHAPLRIVREGGYTGEGKVRRRLLLASTSLDEDEEEMTAKIVTNLVEDQGLGH